jgi:hypothetical protein
MKYHQSQESKMIPEHSFQGHDLSAMKTTYILEEGEVTYANN